MLIVFGVLIGGIILGYFLRKFNLKFLPKLIMIIICLLLFILGIEVGSNPEVVRNLGTLGVRAFLITLSALAGSILCGYLLWIYIKRQKLTDNEE